MKKGKKMSQEQKEHIRSTLINTYATTNLAIIKGRSRSKAYHQNPNNVLKAVAASSIANYGDFDKQLASILVPIGFVEQYIIGKFVVDFANIEAKVIIESDVKRYHRRNFKIKSDARRDKYFKELGWRVIHVIH